MTSKLTQLTQQKTAAQLQTMSQQSISWLKNKIYTLKNPSSIANQISRETNRTKGRFSAGGLYFFFYDAKGKDDLPYWDAFPLVLILETQSDGFLGLNLHYLPPRYRASFLDKLMPYASLNSNDDIKKIRISYDILNTTKSLKEFRPCIKKYLHGQVRSKLLAVQPNEWDVALFLPVQNFQKANSQTVWQESLEDIRK